MNKTVTFLLLSMLALNISAALIPQAGRDWIPVEDTTAVAPGSALDFSGNSWFLPANGDGGRLTVNNAHFELEKNPGAPRKLFGVVLPGDTALLPPEKAEELVSRLVRLGYNSVRLSGFDRAVGMNVPKGGILNEKRLALADNLINACRKHGVYVSIDLATHRTVQHRKMGIDKDGPIPSPIFRLMVIFDEAAYSNYQEFVTALLNHVNAGTGVRWADDPVISFMCLMSDDNPNFATYKFLPDIPAAVTAWKKWLAAAKTKYPNEYRNVSEQIPTDLTQWCEQNYAFSVFLADAQAEFVRKTKTFLRNAVKTSALITDANGYSNPVPLQIGRQDLDYVDGWMIHDGPRRVISTKPFPTERRNFNYAQFQSSGYAIPPQLRFFDKPFTISSFGYPAPAKYRMMEGLLIGAQAGLQGLDGLWHNHWSSTAAGVFDQVPMDYYSIASDPVQRACDRAAMMLFMRGDIQALDTSFVIDTNEKSLRTQLTKGPYLRINELWIGWSRKIGCWMKDARPRNANIYRKISEVFDLEHEQYKKMLGNVKIGKGQILHDPKNGLFGVITPRTCGLFTAKGKADLGMASFEISGAPAAAWVSSLDSLPIDKSKRLLVTHITDVLDTDTVIPDPAENLLDSWGKLPHLMRRGNATIWIKGAGKCKIYALKPDGTRDREIQCLSERGGVKFNAATGANPAKATWLYEIVR